MSEAKNEVDWTICPKCKKHPREIVLHGEMEMYCASCNDKLADNYREQQEFAHYHHED